MVCDDKYASTIDSCNNVLRTTTLYDVDVSLSLAMPAYEVLICLIQYSAIFMTKIYQQLL